MSIRKLASHYTMVGALIAGVGLVAGAVLTARAQSGPEWGPEWTADGELVLPRDYHQWVFLGSPLTPNALNDGEANFPEYHNVYVHPEAFKAFRETGDWPQGTIMLKELQLALPGENEDGSRDEASGRGYFPGARNGIDISVRDSARFKDTNEWGFFNFGHHAPPYAETAEVQPAEDCADCHTALATEMVFSQFYSEILNAK